MARSDSSKIKRFVKIAISLAILAGLFAIVDRNALLKTISEIPLSTAFILIGGYILGQLLSSYKWWIIARSSSVNAPLGRAIKSYFIGMFVNCFGLGLVGGDVARGILLSANQDTKTRSIATVIADRAHGLAVLAFIGTMTAIFLGSDLLDFSALLLLISLGSAVVAGWLIGPRILLLIVKPGNKLRSKAEDVANAFPKDSRTILYITFLSILFHTLQIGLHWVMGAGFGLSLSWSLLFVAIPFINILSALPISWNGVGVREAGYVFFLSAHGVSNEQAIAFGALWLLASTTSSLLGGLIGLLTNDLHELQILKKRSKTPLQFQSENS